VFAFGCRAERGVGLQAGPGVHVFPEVSGAPRRAVAQS
jgi:hypothetical protein